MRLEHSMNNVAIFNSTQTAIVTFQNRKGDTMQRTVEGALFTGGAALAAIKDQALVSALEKAQNGRYRAAAEIIGAGFPSVYKGVDFYVGTPWSNKSTMASLLQAVTRQVTKLTDAGKKRNAKQQSATTVASWLTLNIDGMGGNVVQMIESVDTPEAE
jgi:hypothetical protein